MNRDLLQEVKIGGWGYVSMSIEDFIHSSIGCVVSTTAEYFGVIEMMENDRIRYSLMGRYSSWEKRSHDRLYLA